MADTEQTRGRHTALLAYAKKLGFEPVPHVTFERCGTGWLIKRIDPPAAPLEFWCDDPFDPDFPIAIVRHSPWKNKANGHKEKGRRRRSTAVATLLICSRHEVYSKKGGLDSEVEEVLLDLGVSIERDKPEHEKE